MRAAVVRWAPVVLYMALIFVASAQPVLPDVVEHVWDKARHAAGFGGLALLWLWALSDRLRLAISLRMALLAWVTTVIYGASDEWHQSFVPQRQMDAADWLADSIGATAMVLAAWTWSRLRCSSYNQTRNGL